MHYNLFLKFHKYFIEDKKSFIKYFLLSFIVGFLELCGVALTYPFIKNLMTLSEDNKSILIGCLIILAFLVKNIFMIFYNALQASYIKNCEAYISQKFMRYFLYGEYKQVSNITLATKLHILNFLPAYIVNNYLMKILNLSVNFCIFALIITLLFVKFFAATCITCVCAIALLIFQSMFFKYKTKSISKNLNTVNKELNEAINEPLLNLKNMKILNGEDYFYKKYLDKLDANKKIITDLTYYNSIPPYVTEPFIIILLLILLSIISIQNSSNTSTLIASYALIVSAIFRLTPTISRIQVNLTGIHTSVPQLKELISFYEEFDIKNQAYKREEFKEFNSSIEFKNINFKYQDKYILKDVNFKINKGDFIGIAGASGAGKTTLIDILAGLLKIENGEIYVDNKKSTNYTPKLKIGYIPQEYNTICASIRENVAFGFSDIDDDKVIKSLKQAQLYDFIVENYKEGIYAEPFIDSTGFSQGQKQRLAIARALYTEPDILILDEATSSLDLKTEDEICEVLNSLKGEKTIVAIAHRLSTIKNSNIIYLMQNNTISDKGSFDYLLTHNEYFKELVELNNTNFM